MNRRLAAASVLSLAMSVAMLAGCDRPSSSPASKAAAPAPSKHDFKSVDITGAEYARKLDLTDPSGQRRTLADFKGKVVIVFFGYTQCPDVCPTTMAELAEVRRQLGADGERVQGVFVSIDPDRDTPEILGAYVNHFGAGFTALRGSAEETKAAAKEFRVFYAKAPGREANAYTMDHTAGSFVFDPYGRVRLFVRYGSGAPALVGDIRALLSEG